MSNHESSAAPAVSSDPVHSDAGEECRQDDVVLSIENVAKMFNHPRLALRYYELRGLIKRRYRIGPTRVFGWADCDVIALIIKCCEAGLTMSDIAPVVRWTRGDGATHMLSSSLDPCLPLIDHLERRRERLGEAIDELRQTSVLNSFLSR